MANAVNTFVRPTGSMVLPDNKTFVNRFEIKSASSNRVYVIAQSKSGRWWACSCPGWVRHRNCKHLRSLGLPAEMRPYEVSMR